MAGRPVAANGVPIVDEITTKVKNLADSMVPFVYDPDCNLTFEAYYNRYETVLTTQAADLDEPTKVHLLLQKFQQTEYQCYADSILPSKPNERKLEETVESLKRIFGYKESKFSMRHKCFELKKKEDEDYTGYMVRVNKMAEKFDLNNCSIDDFKVLLLVSGLKAPADSLILEKLLTKVDNQHLALEKAATEEARTLVYKLKLQDLLNEAERITCLKKDKGKVGETSTKSEIYAVHNSSPHQRFKGSNRSWSSQSVQFMNSTLVNSNKFALLNYVNSTFLSILPL